MACRSRQSCVSRGAQARVAARSHCADPQHPPRSSRCSRGAPPSAAAPSSDMEALPCRSSSSSRVRAPSHVQVLRSTHTTPSGSVDPTAARKSTFLRPVVSRFWNRHIIWCNHIVTEAQSEVFQQNVCRMCARLRFHDVQPTGVMCAAFTSSACLVNLARPNFQAHPGPTICSPGSGALHSVVFSC